MSILRPVENFLAQKDLSGEVLRSEEFFLHWPTIVEIGFPAPFKENTVKKMRFLHFCVCVFFSKRYVYTSRGEETIRGVAKRRAIFVVRTVQAVLVTVCEDPMVPEQCAAVTGKLGKYLIDMGY